MKKQVIFGLFLLSLFVLSLSFVSSLAVSPEEVSQTTTNVVSYVAAVGEGLFVPLFGEAALLPRIFLLIILFLLIYSIVPAIFGDKGGLNFIVSIVISLLAMLSIPANFIEMIATQYGVMGSVLLSVIPFMIILLFSLKVKSQLAGRVVWLAYAIFYFATYIYGWATSTKAWNDPSHIAFLAAIVLGILMFFVLGAIRRVLFKGEMSAIKESGKAIVGKAKLLHSLQAEELKGVYGDKDTARN